MYRQYELTQGQSRLTTWLDSDKRLPVGTRLTLVRGRNTAGRPPQGWWTVRRNSHIGLPAPPDVRWRVGGLV